MTSQKLPTPEQWNQMVQEYLLMQQCMGVLMFGEVAPPPLKGRELDPELHQGNWARHDQYVAGEDTTFPDIPAAQKRVNHDIGLLNAPLESLLKKKK